MKGENENLLRGLDLVDQAAPDLIERAEFDVDRVGIVDIPAEERASLLGG